MTGYWQINKLWITVPDSDIFVISYKVDLQQYKRCCPYITLRMVLQSDTWYKLTEYSVICYLLSTPKYCSFIFVQLSFNEWKSSNNLIKIHKMQDHEGFVDIVKWLNIQSFSLILNFHQKNRQLWKYKNEDGLVKILVVRIPCEKELVPCVTLVWLLDVRIFEILINSVSQMASK